MARKSIIRSRYDNGIFVEHRLSNGITVHLQKPEINTDDEGILLAFYPWVGSCVETPHEHGIAHFFEHVPFETRRLAPLDRVGGECNGATNIEWTKYYVTAPKDELELAAKSLEALTVNAKFNERIVARERKVISREYDMVFAKGDNVVGHEISRRFFGATHPYGHLPIGDLSVIQGMTLGQLVSFRDRYYHAGNLHLAVGGAFSEFSEARLLETLERKFGSLSAGVPVTMDPGFPLERKGQRMCAINAAFQRDHHFAWYFSPELLTDHELDVLSFLQYCLNGGQSPLVRELRIKRGWVYTTRLCHSGRNPWLGWMFRFECPTPRQNFPELIPIFRSVLEHLRPRYVQEQLRVRQYQRKSEFFHAVQVVKNLPYSIASHGKKHPYHYWEAIEDSLTVEEVFAWRDRLLAEEPFIFEAMTE